MKRYAGLGSKLVSVKLTWEQLSESPGLQSRSGNGSAQLHVTLRCVKPCTEVLPIVSLMTSEV